MGVTVAAGVLLICGPGAVVPAIVAGAVAEQAFEHRQMSETEARFARKVFGNKLPSRDKIILTNALGIGNRHFVLPEFGDSYFVNLGDAGFADPMGYLHPDYGQPGEMLIHELTHVWQAVRWPATTYFCLGILDSRPDVDGDGSRAWSDYGIEQQANIVSTWYGADPTFLAGEFQKEFPDFSKKAAHPFDHYIEANIKAGLT